MFNLVAPAEALPAGGEVRVGLWVLNPDAEEAKLPLPEQVEGTLLSESGRWRVTLRTAAQEPGVSVNAGGFAVREYVLTLPPAAEGILILEVNEPAAARVALRVDAALPAHTESDFAAPPLRHSTPRRTAEAAIQRTFSERFGLHEPIYFLYGNEPQGAKYQFSFKYRLLGDDRARSGERSTAVRRVYFGYTQRSLWDIDSLSSPFYDSSYMPEFFYESQRVFDEEQSGGLQFLGYQIGAKHESNGRAGPDSRSLNTVYFRPAVTFGKLDSWHLIVAPRFSAYVWDVDDNPDISRYRGYTELQTILQWGDGVSLAALGRLGRGGHKGGLQLDLTIPMTFERFFDFAAYFHIQYWNGYGESLLDYNKHGDALRFGFSLLR
ncbi:hypothetical protein AXK11_01780 [Cephaloticoccus primus]|uniref:Phosphatidylcholine 1-acylhydrolase n=1 Tax=Cephaloticoccus primus TaxID=1548207 RepID=A0A139STJ0_9BACT|nr:hypothetical protein AXK11_01780 [Cephaloticoccus primus]